MQVEPLAVPGVWLFSPVQHRDERGVFLEWLQADDLAAAVGHPLALAQANISSSARGVVRGVHYADVPPGQAKYITCVHGAVLDVAVDLRVGSPTFGRHAAVRLDDVDRRAVYLSEGLGHGFQALTDGATVSYLCSTPYTPEAEHAVDARDPELALPWDRSAPALASPRDAAAPSLGAVVQAGALPRYEDCVRYAERLRSAAARDL